MLEAFENLHPNHKLAYLDGLLCGLGAAYLGYKTYNKILDHLATRMDETESNVYNITTLR